MKTEDYLKILKDEIHSTVFATVDEQGLPAVRVIDIMLVDDISLYFITAKGKAFYSQLKKQGFAAVCGMDGGEGSLSKKAISIRGEVEEIGSGLVEKIFEENPYMKEIYPDKKSRMAISVFRMYKGGGEYFDLSTKPITRHSFLLGEEAQKRPAETGYYITDKCCGCKRCETVCPQKCIDTGSLPYVIAGEHCIHCGNCMEVCPYDAVRKRQEG